MAITTLKKQPDESRLYDFNFTNLLIGSATLVASPAPTMKQSYDGSTTTDLTFGTPSVSSPKVQVRIEDGVDGKLYKVSCVAADSDGNTLEVDGYLLLED